MTPTNTLIEELQEWSQSSGLIEKAIECGKVFLENTIKEDEELGFAGPWKLTDIQLIFDKQSLVFKNDILSYPYVDTQIGLYVAADSKAWFRDLMPIGKYHLITALDGEVLDDYLQMDDFYK